MLMLLFCACARALQKKQQEQDDFLRLSGLAAKGILMGNVETIRRLLRCILSRSLALSLGLINMASISHSHMMEFGQ